MIKMEVKLTYHAAYGGIALFISLLNNIFLLYYVDTFVNVYKIDSRSFWIGEVCIFHHAKKKACQLRQNYSIIT